MKLYVAFIELYLVNYTAYINMHNYYLFLLSAINSKSTKERSHRKHFWTILSSVCYSQICCHCINLNALPDDLFSYTMPKLTLS